MYEVEVKIAADLDTVRRRLRELSAEAGDSVRQTDVYFDHPTRDFSVTDEALRLRREVPEGPEIDQGREGTAVLTYKGPLIDDVSKTRREVESVVDDPDTLSEILLALGFREAATVRKRRERYAISEHTVTLDDVDGVGEYVEVEIAGRRSNLASLRSGVFDLCYELDLEPADQLRTSYLELLLENN